MKRLTALLVALPTVALAHAGDHSGLGLTHLISEPDHLVLIAACVAVVALVVYKLWSRP
ncbi:MAG: hypothetical protein RLZZ607_1029 [Pseudomonadota bacterium]|jgi:hypothetical protein